MPDSQETRLEGRNGEVWRWYSIRGKTQEWIGQHYGIHQVRVSQIIAEVRNAIPPIDKAELVQESMELIKEVKARAMEIVDMAGAPIAVGKDGIPLIDPDTGEVVRDYSGRLRALDMALKADDTLSKRLGLDSATKVETMATVKVELVGVDTNDLA